MLITQNEYKILQQAALDTSCLILNGFGSKSAKRTGSVQPSGDADVNDSLESVKAEREKKIKQTKIVEVFNADPQAGFDLFLAEGIARKGEE